MRPLPVPSHTLPRSGRSAGRAAGSKAKYAVRGAEPGLATAMSRRAAASAGAFKPQEQGVVNLTWALAAFGLEGRCCNAVPCFDHVLWVLRRPLIAEETLARRRSGGWLAGRWSRSPGTEWARCWTAATAMRRSAALSRKTLPVLRRRWLLLVCPGGFSYVSRFCARARKCVSQFLSSKLCG